MEKKTPALDVWTSIGTYFSGFSPTNQAKFIETMGRVSKSTYTKKEVETIIVSCTKLEADNCQLKHENERLRENINDLENDIKKSSTQANLIARTQQKKIDDLNETHKNNELRIESYMIMERKYNALLEDLSATKTELARIKPELDKYKDLKDRHRRILVQVNEANKKIEAFQSMEEHYKIISKKLPIANGQIALLNSEKKDLNSMVYQLSAARPYLYNCKVLEDIVTSISEQINKETMSEATWKKFDVYGYTVDSHSLSTKRQEKIIFLSSQLTIARDHLVKTKELESKIETLVQKMSVSQGALSIPKGTEDKVTFLLRQLADAEKRIDEKESLQEELESLRDKYTLKDMELFKAQNSYVKQTKQSDITNKAQTRKINYFQQRLEEVESDFTKRKLKEILRKVSDQCYTLKKFLNPKDEEVNAFFFRHFGEGLPGIKALCTKKPDGKRGFSSGVINLLVEKIIINNLLRDICHMPSYFGVPSAIEYPKLSDYTPEKQTPEFSSQFRRNFENLLKDPKTSDALRKRREKVASVLVKLLHELFPAMNPYVTRKKMMEIVEAAAELSLSIHTQDLAVNIVKLIEGKDQLRTYTKTQLGSSAGAKTIQIVICPPFIANEGQKTEHVLLEGKVICLEIVTDSNEASAENYSDSDSEPMENRMYM
ncbi:STAT transcription factor [Phycomyces blakesleeanus]|uniref:STAT transcription factor n=1 Tax=Phycomyces blakesleeanus TaxID=4837 RepID=A0ABR3AL29_PHYBL